MRNPKNVCKNRFALCDKITLGTANTDETDSPLVANMKKIVNRLKNKAYPLDSISAEIM